MGGNNMFQIQMPEHKELMDYVLNSNIGTVLSHQEIRCND